MNNIKAVLFDADGVFIQRTGFFSEKLSLEHNIPKDKVTPFFKERLGLCQIGKSDLKEELKPYLTEWQWTQSVDDFLNYWFSMIKSDQEVLGSIDRLKAKGIKAYIASNNEKYRAEAILAIPEIKDRFSGSFFSYVFGYKKSNPEFFQTILNDLNLKPSEVVYFDNDQANVDAAKSVGINAYIYGDYHSYQNVIKDLQ